MQIKNLFKYWTLQIFNPGAVIKDKYASFQSLLEKDKHAHELMAELEEIYYDQVHINIKSFRELRSLLRECGYTSHVRYDEPARPFRRLSSNMLVVARRRR